MQLQGDVRRWRCCHVSGLLMLFMAPLALMKSAR
uniref:Uncharacterized protein n=1 Tax=uncultured marine bacterium 582 TaxID=257402 RepID=Q6SEW6_9BACT|nr:hypothetical protein MBMO_EBAC080-L028H02.122 [uncultured marine bacterium 582]